MGFQDIMQGIQFFSGLSGGFAKQLDEERRQNEANQLRILAILKSEGTHDIDTVDASDVVSPSGGDRFFGTGNYKTVDGVPVFKVGSQFIKAKKKTLYTPEQLLGPAEETPAPSGEVTQTPLTPSAPAAPEGNIFGTPPPATPRATPTAPATTTPQTSTSPTGSTYLAPYQALAKPLRTQIDTAVQRYASKYSIPYADAYALMGVESGFDPAAKSPKGAIGLMQLMPDTAAMLKVDPTNIDQNIEGGLRYYRQLLDRFKDPVVARAAYNAGPEAVAKAGNKVPNYPETIAHGQRVAQASRQFQQILPGGQQVAQAGQQPGEGAMAGTTPQGGVAGRQAPATPGAAETPDTSMMVAGEAAPGVQPASAPSALPPLPSMPAAPTEDQYIRSYIRKNLTVPMTQENAQKTIQTLREKATAQYWKERDEVRKEKLPFMKDEDDPQLKAMLERVQTTAQLDHYLRLRNVSSETKKRILSQAVDYLAPLGPDQLSSEAPKVWAKMIELGIKEPVATQLLKKVGYDDQAKLDQLKREIQQKQELETANLPADLARKRAEELQKQELAHADRPARLEEEQAKLQMQLEEKRASAAIEKQAAIDLKEHAHSLELVPPEKRKSFVDPDTLIADVNSMTWAELNEKRKAGKLIELSPQRQELVAHFAPTRAIAMDILDQVETVFGKGGPLEGVAQEKGTRGRLTGRAAKIVYDSTQSNPEVRVLDERLKEWGVQATRTIEGLGARPAAVLMKPALSVRPSLGEPGSGPFGLIGGTLPDTKETIVAQITAAQKLIDRNLMMSLGRIPAVPPEMRTLFPHKAGELSTTSVPAPGTPKTVTPAESKTSEKPPALSEVDAYKARIRALTDAGTP